ncbi:MAG: hypothetical protein JWM82_2501, partial [Myxococcales bacterium]|nr:hypothetical protein [Myxococcales bacterium]
MTARRDDTGEQPGLFALPPPTLGAAPWPPALAALGAELP